MSKIILIITLLFFSVTSRAASPCLDVKVQILNQLNLEQLKSQYSGYKLQSERLADLFSKYLDPENIESFEVSKEKKEELRLLHLRLGESIINFETQMEEHILGSEFKFVAPVGSSQNKLSALQDARQNLLLIRILLTEYIQSGRFDDEVRISREIDGTVNAFIFAAKANIKYFEVILN